MKTKIKFLAALVVLVSLFGLGGYLVQKNNTLEENNNRPKAESDFSACFEDTDCITVPAKCCGCNAGGKNTVINKKFRQEWNEKLAEECQGQFCPQVISDHWTCTAQPKCVNKRCILPKNK